MKMIVPLKEVTLKKRSDIEKNTVLNLSLVIC